MNGITELLALAREGMCQLEYRYAQHPTDELKMKLQGAERIIKQYSNWIEQYDVKAVDYAIGNCGSEDVDFDRRPLVAYANEGLWVNAWVWVPEQASKF